LEAIVEVHTGGAPLSSHVARMIVETFHRRGCCKREVDKLTRRENQILTQVVEGSHTKEIAAALGLSSRTVGTHLCHVFEKLQVHSRAQAVAKYLRNGS
jgi:DNA-binding NarL/FixJ family response regulator